MLPALRTAAVRIASQPQLATHLPRAAAAIAVRSYSASLRPRPAPPRLPKEEQEEFERLQKESTGAFQTSNTVDAEAALTEEEVHRDLRRGAEPEFEGDVNPKTGEVGGPKNDPLIHREWTFNGRATDF